MKKLILQSLKRKVSLSIILIFVLLSGFAQTNLITNGDFENQTTGWMIWGATLAPTTDAHSGIGAALVSNRKNPWDALARDVKSILVNGENYTISAWVKIPQAGQNFRITLGTTVDGQSSYLGLCRTPSPKIGSYTYYTETFPVKWTGNLQSANLYFELESVGGVYSDYLVDDVQLVKFVPIPDIIQKGSGLKNIKSSMLIGGCIGGTKNYFNSEAARAQVLKDCNTTTITCYPAWGRWDEVKHHVYHVEDFSSKIQEMKKQQLNVTAHMLLGWDQYFPDWYKNNDFPADTLDAIMKSWLKGIIQYKGNDTLVDVWNVVNEAISWDGKGGYWPENNADHLNACEMQRMGYEPDASGLTGKQYVNAQHPVYIRKSFEYARTLTKKKLELRDSGIEFPTDAKYNAFYQLAVHLKKMNAPVDVIGFQTHIDLEKTYDWEGYTNNIKRYVQLGYEVNIPEVDIGDAAKSWSDYKAELQKIQFYKLVTAAIRGGASEFQTWGFIDDNEDWRKGQSAFPYTNHFEMKPAYYGIQEALTDMSSILYWEMDAPTNNLMPDIMKYNNFGTLNNFGTPAIVSGFKSNALQFDGIDDYISSAKLSENISWNLTFSCFLKTSANKAGIIADIAQDGISGLKIGINPEGKIYLNAAEAGLSIDLVGSTAVNDNAWHFIAIQRDSLTYRLYIDDSTPVASGKGTIQNFDQLTVGAKSDGSQAFEGAIDEVKLYASAIEEGSFVRGFAPFPPMKLAIQTNALRIKLTWLDQSSNENGFVVERKTKDGNWEECGRVGANIMSFIDVLDQYDTEYSYRVSSFTTIGKSAASNTITYVTPKDPNTGILENSANMLLSVYPNPVHDKFTLVSSESARIKIVDIQGKLLLEKDNLSASETVDISNFTSGIYFLQTFDNKKTNVAKLIKQ